MARIRLADIIGHMGPDMQRALSDAVGRVLPGVNYDQHHLFSEFKKAVGRKFKAWENVPDHCVEK